MRIRREIFENLAPQVRALHYTINNCYLHYKDCVLVNLSFIVIIITCNLYVYDSSARSFEKIDMGGL